MARVAVVSEGVAAAGVGLGASAAAVVAPEPVVPAAADPTSQQMAAILDAHVFGHAVLADHAAALRAQGAAITAQTAAVFEITEQANAALFDGGATTSAAGAVPALMGPIGAPIGAPVLPGVPDLAPPTLTGETYSQLLRTGPGAPGWQMIAATQHAHAAQLWGACENLLALARLLAASWDDDGAQQATHNLLQHAGWLDTAAGRAQHLATAAESLAGDYDRALAYTPTPAQFTAARQQWLTAWSRGDVPALIRAGATYTELDTQAVDAMTEHHASAQATATTLGDHMQPAPAVAHGEQPARGDRSATAMGSPTGGAHPAGWNTNGLNQTPTTAGSPLQTAASTPPAAATPPSEGGSVLGALHQPPAASAPTTLAPASPGGTLAGATPGGTAPTLRPGPAPSLGAGGGGLGGTGIAPATTLGPGSALGSAMPRLTTGAITPPVTTLATPAALGPHAAGVQALAHIQPAEPTPPEPPDPEPGTGGGSPSPASQDPKPTPPPATDLQQATDPPPTNHPTPPNPAPTAPLNPSTTGITTPAPTAPAPGTGPSGTHALDFGIPGIAAAPPPQAPRFPPFPLHPPPPAPPPPSPGDPPLRPAPTPSWARTPPPTTSAEAQKQYDDVIRDIKFHNSHPPAENDWNAVSDYNADAWRLNTWKAQLETQLEDWNTQYTPYEPTAIYGDDITRGWTVPAPENPHPPVQPGTPANPNLAEQATQIGERITKLPKGSRADALASEMTALHLNQQQAAEATDIASKATWGMTIGFITLPEEVANIPAGTKVVLPAMLQFGKAMLVHPDGSVTVFIGNLDQFLPYLG